MVNMNTAGELPAPKKIVGMVTSAIEAERCPPPKRDASIREIDNGYIVHVNAGIFHEEWAFNKLNSAIKAIVAFLSTNVEEEK